MTETVAQPEPGPLPAEPGVDLQLKVIRIDARHDARWLAFVAHRTDALVYHHPAWLEILAETYGYAEESLACVDEHGNLHGVLPLFRTRGVFTGRRLSSLPHTPHAGPVGSDAAIAKLLRAAMARATARRARLQIKSPNRSFADLAPAIGSQPWEPTYVLALPDSPERLRFGNSRNHTRVKGKVTQSERNGVRVREARSRGDLRAWYRLYLETMRRHAVPPRPYRFFDVAWRILRPRGMLRILLAEQGTGPSTILLAGSVFLVSNATVIYRFNGSRHELLHLHPNDAIQWRAIHDACRDGYQRYDFGEVEAGNAGLAMFKSKWGAVAEPLFRYGYPAPRELERGVLRPDSPVRRVAQAAWRALPLSATQLFGDQLYRRL